VTTPPPAEAPGGADRELFVPSAKGTELPTEATRYLVTTPDVVKDAMALYKLALRVREASRRRSKAEQARNAADAAYKDAEEAFWVAQGELNQALRGDA
jgi:hypothetical protein